MKKPILFLILTFCVGANCFAQKEYVYQTFKDTRVINAQSTEILPKRKLDFRIAHRFGDLAGDQGGWNNFYGLENAADVMIGFEYGITDNLMIGVNRTKGTGILRQLVNTFFKYRLLRQGANGGSPISMAIYGVSTASTSAKASGDNLLNSFEETAHRFSYTGQLIISRKFGDNFSLQLTGGVQHRNLVDFDEENTMIMAGASAKYQFSKVFGLIVDFSMPFSDTFTTENGFYPALGL